MVYIVYFEGSPAAAPFGVLQPERQMVSKRFVFMFLFADFTL